MKNKNNGKSGQRWLFASDTWFTRCHDAVYTLAGGAFNPAFWAPYLAHAGSLYVLGREATPALAKQADTLSSCADVAFTLGPNISTPIKQFSNGRAARALVRDAVASCDAMIVRLPSEYGLLCAYEADRIGKPWLVTLTGCPWDGLWNYGTWQGKVYAPVMFWRTRRVLAQAPFALYVTQEFLQRRYSNKTGRSIGCSDVMIDTPQEAVLQKRLQRIADQQTPIKLGLIGTLKNRVKGIQTVYAALEHVQSQLPSVEFHVLGGGDTTPWMEEAKSHGVANLVHFDTPRSPGAEVFAWLDGIDVYLQPSFKEGLPRATVEAMSRACPAIGSTCAGIPELLSDDCLIKPGDYKHLARLILQAVTDRDWQKHQAEANWQKAHEYSSEILDARRDDFLAEFARAVESSKT